jgi:hypothetical protein
MKVRRTLRRDNGFSLLDTTVGLGLLSTLILPLLGLLGLGLGQVREATGASAGPLLVRHVQEAFRALPDAPREPQTWFFDDALRRTSETSAPYRAELRPAPTPGWASARLSAVEVRVYRGGARQPLLTTFLQRPQ